MALTAGKAKKMLEDGTVHGRALTDKQKKYFGAIAGGATPMKKINGGWLDKYAMGGSLPGASGMMYARTNTPEPLYTQSEMKAQEGDTVMYGTPEYEAAYKEGRFKDVPNPLDEVVVRAGVDYEKYPLYDKLSPQQKEYFFDDGPIGRGVRRAAQTDRGLYEDTLDVVNPILYTAIGSAGLMSPLGRTLGVSGRYLGNKILNFKPFNPGSYGGTTSNTLAGSIRNRNILDAVGLGYGSYNLPEVSRNLYNDPSLSTAGDFALNTLNFLPILDTSYRGITNSFNLRSGLNRTLERIKNPFRQDKNLMSTGPSPFGFGKGPKYDATQFNLARTNNPAFMERYNKYVYQQGDPTLIAQLNSFKRQERIVENQINNLLKLKKETLQPNVVTMADGSLELSKPLTISSLNPSPGIASLLREKNLIQGQINRLNTTLTGAKYSRQNLDKLQNTGVFTKIQTPTLKSDIKYFAENPNTVGFYDYAGDLDRLPNTSIISTNRLEDFYRNPTVRYNKSKYTIAHEDGHALNAGGRGTKPIYSRDISAAMNPRPKGYDKLTPKEQKTIAYLTKPTEVHSRIDELRMAYIPKKYWGTDQLYNPSDDLLNKIISDGLAGKTSVDSKFFNLIGDKKQFKDLFRNLQAVATPIAVGAATQMKDGGRCWPGYKTVPGKTPFSKGSCTKAKDGAWLDKYEVIEDDMGQLTNPGKITKINSNNITMKGVDFPVLGISDTGDKKMMLPGNDYKFDGKSVTEYPMAQFGFVKDLVDRGSRLLSSYSPTMLFNYKNYEDGNYLPVFNQAKNKDEAFKQARNDLGPGKRFIYDGVRYTTDYYGETGDKYTQDLLNRFKDEPYYDRLIEVWNEAGQPNIRGKADDVNLFGGFGPAITDFTGDRPFFNPLNKTNTIYLGYDPSIRSSKSIAKTIVKELGHGINIQEQGTVPFLLNLGAETLEQLPNTEYKGDVKQYFTDAQNKTYRTPGTEEYHTHEIQEKKILGPYIFEGVPRKKKQGGSLVKLNQLTNFTNYNTPQPGGWLEKYN